MTAPPTASPPATDTIDSQRAKLRAYFAEGATRDIGDRLDALKRLRSAIKAHEQELCDALHADLHKAPQESYMTEIAIVLNEINLHIRKLRRWARPRRVGTPLFMFGSSSRIVPQPLGVALVIAPWNYPFQLLVNPLIGAISAGNCAMLKPSPYVPAVNTVIRQIVAEALDPAHVAMVEGGREVNTSLLARQWDYIFFTGSPALGHVVMQAAARFLTPLTLELGGKSPCIVDRGADLDIAARRIAWGKLINAGQTCVAPDYLLVQNELRQPLLNRIAHYIQKSYGRDARQSPDYPRMVNTEALERVAGLIARQGTVAYGGEVDPADRYIEPTIIEGVRPDDPVMQQEIFGPVLPVITYDTLDEALALINDGEKPLALYYFGPRLSARQVIARTASGGACINDVVMHLANDRLPFGGVGRSGMGKYHGRYSFETFSNLRAVVRASTRIDFPVRYAPYGKLSILKKLIK